jgi:hypothetical protein
MASCLKITLHCMSSIMIAILPGDICPMFPILLLLLLLLSLLMLLPEPCQARCLTSPATAQRAGLA